VSTAGDLKLRPERARATHTAGREATALEGSRIFRWLVRAGFVARGITYGVIGALALAIALGAGRMGTTPNQEGALALIARSTVGRPALALICAGLLAYAIWKLTQGLFGYGPEGGGSAEVKDRVGNFAGGVAYVTFFAVAVRVLVGSPGNSSREPRQASSGILGWPGGELIVGGAGVALIVISLYQLYDALCGGFLKDSKASEMNPRERRLFLVLGRIGLSARALVFVLIGYFLLRTAIDYNPASATGVDGALARLHHQPLGAWLVGLVGAGLLIFAAHSIFEARYRRL
jgi:hypothetical protein